jgi:hypothetical protein
MMSEPYEEWWLSEPALPDLYWARLTVHDDGKASVHVKGQTYAVFGSKEDALHWLNEDEYYPFNDLMEDGELPDGTMPPTAQSDDEPIEEIVRYNAELVIRQMKAGLGVNLAYDEASVVWLDGYIERNRSTLAQNTIDMLINTLGSFLGVWCSPLSRPKSGEIKVENEPR